MIPRAHAGLSKSETKYLDPIPIRRQHSGHTAPTNIIASIIDNIEGNIVEEEAKWLVDLLHLVLDLVVPERMI